MSAWGFSDKIRLFNVVGILAKNDTSGLASQYAVATSMVAFARSISASLRVSIFGAIFNSRLARELSLIILS